MNLKKDKEGIKLETFNQTRVFKQHLIKTEELLLYWNNSSLHMEKFCQAEKNQRKKFVFPDRREGKWLFYTERSEVKTVFLTEERVKHIFRGFFSARPKFFHVKGYFFSVRSLPTIP